MVTRPGDLGNPLIDFILSLGKGLNDAQTWGTARIGDITGQKPNDWTDNEWSNSTIEPGTGYRIPGFDSSGISQRTQADARMKALNERFRKMLENPDQYSGIPMRNQPAYQRPDSMARAMPIPNAKIGADPMADAQRMPYNPSSDSMESNMLPVTAPAKPDAGFDLGRWLGSLFGGK